MDTAPAKRENDMGREQGRVLGKSRDDYKAMVPLVS